MTTCHNTAEKRLQELVRLEILTPGELRTAEETASTECRGLEEVLMSEFGIPKRAILQALSVYHNCPFIEYDERMPVPPELLTGLSADRLSLGRWFPVIRDAEAVVIAAADPDDQRVIEEVKNVLRADRYEFWVALEEDIQWFIQDFLHDKPGCLIGTERTGLAYWRNTMAHWRTRLACYRNDLAKGRTNLALLRWGLGFIALSDTLMRTHKSASVHYLYWVMLATGFVFAIAGFWGYLKVRRHRIRPPGHETLVEVTAATLHFLEHYHFIEETGVTQQTKGTMLARLGDSLADYSTILYPSPASKERTHLARERNVLAGQRTVMACYRTIYSRARTGLSFIRTGVAFLGLGLGLVQYFGISIMTSLDLLLITAGTAMIADGALWYFPVRKEQAELPRCPVA